MHSSDQFRICSKNMRKKHGSPSKIPALSGIIEIAQDSQCSGEETNYWEPREVDNSIASVPHTDGNAFTA